MEKQRSHTHSSKQTQIFLTWRQSLCVHTFYVPVDFLLRVQVVQTFQNLFQHGGYLAFVKGSGSQLHTHTHTHTHKTGWGCRAHDRSQTKSKDLPGPEPNLLPDIPLWSIVYCPKGKTRHLDMNSEVGKHWKISIMTNCVIALIHWVSQLKSEFHNVSFCRLLLLIQENTGKHDIRWITTFVWDK